MTAIDWTAFTAPVTVQQVQQWKAAAKAANHRRAGDGTATRLRPELPGRDLPQRQQPRRLPHLLLDSLQNNMFGLTGVAGLFARDQVLSLEGDFDRYFTPFCPKQYERDALSVFTPDLMALCIDEAAPFDIEIGFRSR